MRSEGVPTDVVKTGYNGNEILNMSVAINGANCQDKDVKLFNQSNQGMPTWWSTETYGNNATREKYPDGETYRPQAEVDKLYQAGLLRYKCHVNPA